MFYVPAEVKEHFAAKLDGCAANEAAWNALMDDYKMVYPELAKELEDRIAGNSMVNLTALEAIFKDTVKNATREASGDIIQVLAAQLPELVGGSADLGPSNKTIMKLAVTSPSWTELAVTFTLAFANTLWVPF